MFKGKNVIILGAGSSVDFGLPTGEQLFSQLLSDCEVYFKEAQDIGRGQLATFHSDRNFFDHPVASTVNEYATLQQETHSAGTSPAVFDQMQKLSEALRRTTAETIDEFVTLNPSLSHLCRMLMAQRFFLCLHEKHDGQFRRRSFVARQLKGVRNWTHLFINALKTNYLRGHKPDNLIEVVSFNYDPILCWALDELFDASEVSIGPWRDYYRIHQVYGCLDPAQMVGAHTGTIIAAWAKLIRTVGVVGEEAAGIDDAIRETVRTADMIYAAGFAFAQDNCRLIGLDKRSKALPITYVNYDGSPGLNDRVARYSNAVSIFGPNMESTLDEKSGLQMTMTRAIGLGFLGELPA